MKSHLFIFALISFALTDFSPLYVLASFVKDELIVGVCVLFCFFLYFLGPHPEHMEVPRLGVGWELQLPAYTTATATRDLSYF